MAGTANEFLLDESLRRQVALRRLTTREVREVLELLEKSDAQLIKLIRSRLARTNGRIDFSTARWAELVKSIRELRTETIAKAKTNLLDDLREIAVDEGRFELALLELAIPVELSLASVPAPTLRAVVTSKPFAGGTNLGQWFQKLARADAARVTQAIQLGVVQGETIDQMVRRIAGTRSMAYKDGILAMTRRDATAVVRTAVNHVSNAAREEVWLANDDIVAFVRWTSTLDGRTTPICRARDGALAPIGDHEVPRGQSKLVPPGARPPAHVSCRSTTTSVLDPEGISDRMGERPMVRDTRTRRLREMDFRAEAREAAGGRWSEMDAAERNAAIRRVREKWTRDNVGQVPAKLNYQEWLKKQPAAFQDDVLGPARGALFRRGGLSLKEFVDRRGRELSLRDLRAMKPGAFEDAGL